jgi:hypothetical protein
VTAAAPGSAQGLQLTVSDIDGARAELASHGADVSEVFHDERLVPAGDHHPAARPVTGA